MIKNQQLKCPLICILVFNVLALAIEIGVIVYQGVAKYVGFDWEEDSVTSCSSNYLNYKLSLDHQGVSISYIGAIVATAFGLASLIVVCMAMAKYVQKKKELEDLEGETDPLKKTRGMGQINEYNQFFTFGKIILLYFLFSLAILGALVHFGMILGLLLLTKSCEDGTVKKPYLIAAILGGCCVFFLTVCWIILQILRCKVHDYLTDYDEELSEMPVAGRENNKNSRADVYRQKNKPYEQMHTMYPLQQTQEDATKNDEQPRNTYENNTHKPFVKSQRGQTQNSKQNSNQPATPLTFAENEEQKNNNYNSRPYDREQVKNYRGQYSRSPQYERDSPKNSRVRQSRFERNRDPSPPRNFFAYMKEQNDNSPVKKEEVLRNQTNGNPYFRSPARQQDERRSPPRREDIYYQRDSPRHDSPKRSNIFGNSYYHPEDNHEALKHSHRDSRANEPYNRTFSKMLRNEQKNYLEENKNGSVLGRDSIYERQSRDPGHRELKHQIRGSNMEEKREHNQKKKKGLLIDYIRSKYAD